MMHYLLAGCIQVTISVLEDLDYDIWLKRLTTFLDM